MVSLGRLASLAALGVLAACGQSNTYVAPPPPKVTVAKPVEQKVTRYFEATGRVRRAMSVVKKRTGPHEDTIREYRINAAAVNSANLVARVQGFLTEIKYTDGAAVKKGEHLFTIEPEPYQLRLQQAQAAEASADATVKQTEADFERQQELVQRQAASAWAAHADGNNDAALQWMRSAADLEDTTEKHPVTPGPILPARELLGELFMELDHLLAAVGRAPSPDARTPCSSSSTRRRSRSAGAPRRGSSTPASHRGCRWC